MKAFNCEKKMSPGLFKKYFLQNVFRNYIFDIYVLKGVGIKGPTLIDMLLDHTHNPTHNTHFVKGVLLR